MNNGTPVWTLLKLDYNPDTRLLALSYKKDHQQTGYQIDVYAVPARSDMDALHAADHCLIVTPKNDGIIVSEIGDVKRGIDDDRPETVLFHNDTLSHAIAAFRDNAGAVMGLRTCPVAWHGTVFEPGEIPAP